MAIARRVSAVFKDLPGGQMLGPTYDYTHRLIDFMLAAGATPPPAPEAVPEEGFVPRVHDILGDEGLMETDRPDDRQPGDLTREPLAFPAGRDVRLQALARGDEGFLLALGYSTQRGYGGTHPFAGEIRHGRGCGGNRARRARLRHRYRRHLADRVPDGQPVQGLQNRAAAIHPRLRAGVRPLPSARPWRWRWWTARCGRKNWART